MIDLLLQNTIILLYARRNFVLLSISGTPYI